MIAGLLLMLIPATLGSQMLPTYMLGDYQMETSEGFTDFMYELGVGWFKRSIACTLYPVQKLSQAPDGEITLDTLSSLSSTYTKFKIGEEWEEDTADGRETKTVARLEGNKLIKVQIPDPSTGYHSTTEVREFVDKGNTMKLILTIEGKPEIRSVRVYKKQLA